MNIRRVWASSPPRWGDREPTLADLVADFMARRSDPASKLAVNRDDIPEYCAEAPTLSIAILRACASRRKNGKLHNHQSRVWEASRAELCARLRRRRVDLEKCATFDTLFRIVTTEAAKVEGIGPVTTYDVATRIAYRLDLPPSDTYLHAGAMQGAREAAMPIEWDKQLGPLIKRFNLPPALQPLTPDEVEDFLCVYRSVLGESTT